MPADALYAQFGFVRWTIPAGMGMGMLLDGVPDTLSFHSPSGKTASVRVQAIDLSEETKNDRALLFQSTAQVNLWENEE